MTPREEELIAREMLERPAASPDSQFNYDGESANLRE